MSARPCRAWLLAAAALILTAAGCTSEETKSAIPVTQLMAGQCFDLDAGHTTAFVYPDCSASHAYEALSVEQLDSARFPGEAPFPGDSALAREASALCAAAMSKAPALYVDASRTALFLAPSEQSWGTEGDRRVVCVFTAPATSPQESPTP